MKRLIVHMFVMAVVSALLFSCHEQEVFEVSMNEDIVLDLSTGTTRAASTSTEAYVAHIDIFIFADENGKPASKIHYERQQVNNASMLTMQARRSTFAQGQKFHVYLVANSTLSVAVFDAMTTFSDLLNAQQEDPMLHFTGLSLENAPKYFLMDAIARDAAGNSPVVLNNGNVADNTNLTATLRRAAAKVVANITASDNIEFRNFTIADGSEGGLYYVRNLSYDAFLLAEAKEDNQIEAKVRTTPKVNTQYFSWNPEADKKNVSLIVYAYPNHWSNTSLMEHETCIVMNLPMRYTDEDGNVTDYYNSWYKIPMTDDQTLRRNNYYEVSITLNRPGAITDTEPVNIDPVYYAVEEWTETPINVGGEDKPVYLMVNRSELEMRNISFDNTTLEFASSSPVTVKVKDVYYYNKYGLKTNVSNAGISGTTDGGMAGNITVDSPVPTNNTIRYFTLEVTNQEGIVKEVTVEQYPLVYITNIQSKYSYRSDFLFNSGDPTGTATADHYEDRGSYSRFAVNYSNGSHSYSRGGNKSSGFFVSKFVNSTFTTGNNNGLSDVRFYTNNWTGEFNSPYNARMYHIRITATSDDYILGKPKITEGITDPGTDNARMVSPSFMIASRLGTLTTSAIEIEPEDYGANKNYWGDVIWPNGSDRAGYEAAFLKVYAEHAKQYVEVYTDPDTGETIHLSDWRLPTEAELEIIYQYQGEEGENAAAIDYLLNAGSYYSASGPVPNSKSNMDGMSVRCIRDVY